VRRSKAAGGGWEARQGLECGAGAAASAAAVNCDEDVGRCGPEFGVLAAAVFGGV